MLFNKLLGANVATPVLLTYVGQVSSSSSNAVHNLLNVNIGTASTDRLVVCVCAGATGNARFNLVSASIAGIAATVNAFSPYTSSGAGTCQTGIFSRVVPLGTTANISVTWFDKADGINMAVYTLTNWQSATPVDTYSLLVGASSSITATLDTVAQGATIFVTGNSASGSRVSWSSATENYDGYAGNSSMATAHLLPTVSTVDYVETVSGSSGKTITAATWR